MNFRLVAFLFTLLVLGRLTSVAHARSEEQTIELSTTVMKEFLDLRVKGIPASLLAEAHGIAIIPNVIKVGLVVGGQRGKGVLLVKEKSGGWKAPTFLTMTGGSLGWQAGAQATDIVLVFKTQQSVEGLLKGKFTIGADAAAAAGPVGRRVGAATDAELKAEIYSYSRSRGLFAGVSLDGTALQIDNGLNAAYYGAAAPGKPVPEGSLKLVELIAQVTANPEAALPAAEPGPAPVGKTPLPEAERLRMELAQAAAQLHPKLDDAWRQYLALPAEIFQGQAPPPLDTLRASQAKYESVAADARYRTLAQQPEFQTTRSLLRAYTELLAAQGPPRLALPPPPGGRTR